MSTRIDREAALADVGAVVVTHRNLGAATRCVRALRRDLDRESVVLVVNDPSAADSAQLSELRAEVGVVVCNARPTGYGANANSGIARLPSRCTYALVLNDDAEPEREAVARLRATLEIDPSAALAGALLVDAKGEPQQSWHRYPSLAGEIAAALMLPARLERGLAERYVDPSAEEVAAHGVWPVGAALLVQTDALRAVHGFDERFYLYSEETDLARRLSDRGWRVIVCRDAVVCHDGAQSTGDDYQRLLGLSRWRYIRKHWSLAAQVVLVSALPVVYAWNALYVAVRVLLSPSSLPEKAGWWRSRWVKRPLPNVWAVSPSPARSSRP